MLIGLAAIELLDRVLCQRRTRTVVDRDGDASKICVHRIIGLSAYRAGL